MMSVDIEKLEKRLANTEAALFALWNLMQDSQPPHLQYSAGNMIEDYFQANADLGASFDVREFEL